MSLRELDNLVGANLLKREPGDQKEFDGLLASGCKRLADSENKELSSEGRFDLAYNAAHALSLAALRWHGYRPANKRFIVFLALAHTLGMNASVWRVLAKCHDIRNVFEYDGNFNADDQLLTDLTTAARQVEKAVCALGPIARAEA